MARRSHYSQFLDRWDAYQLSIRCSHLQLAYGQPRWSPQEAYDTNRSGPYAGGYNTGSRELYARGHNGAYSGQTAGYGGPLAGSQTAVYGGGSQEATSEISRLDVSPLPRHY